MKAIIMAGGEGSRLRPLTCNRPKPMVPVVNRPIMAYCVDLLKKYGITEIGVTLRYLPDAIQEYFRDGSDFGVRLRYFIEESPLGTAGSVKNAASFLDRTFVVVSGDALTDVELSEAVAFHRKQGALATIVLTRVKCPLEYGVVITGESGRIRRFLEKPGWGEVFSDTVNTGIYILEPEVLDYFAANQEFDFSKDLFPLLLRENKPLYGVVLDGYWCDVGGLEVYLQAQQDVLSRKVRVTLPGREVAPGIWVEDGAAVDPTARLEGPLAVGAGVRVGPGANLGAFTVLGAGCIIQSGASIKRSVLWDHCFVGRGAALRGAVLGNNVQVQANAGVYEGAVVGDHSVIRERGLLKPCVKLWPYKFVDMGATVHESLIWGNGLRRHLFGSEGVSGLANVEITPEFAARLGGCFGAVLGKGAAVGLSSDAYPASAMIKTALAAGLQSVGVAVKDFGTGTTPMHRFAVRAFGCQGGAHVKFSTQDPDKLRIVFTDAEGGDISRGAERKVEQVYYREDFPRETAAGIRPPEYVPGVPETYLNHICSHAAERFKTSGLRLVLLYEEANLGRFLAALAQRTGITFLKLGAGESRNRPRRWQDYQEMLPAVSETVVELGADGGAALDASADHLVLIDERGRIIQDDLFTAILALVALKQRGGPVVVPVTAPRAIDALAARYRAEVVRTKAARRDLWKRALMAEAFEMLLHFDALAALVRIFSFVTEQGMGLGDLVDEVPAFFLAHREVPVSWEAKGRVIRELIEEKPQQQLELIDGVKVFHPDGWALILPDPEEPVCRVFSEGASMEIAESLTEFYTQKIKKMLGE
ncbi:MAG: mannose-1-phosphate guanyltransferase [Bacillota bacterium]|nr:mannose-1-phosphate guanyltransferase [Thermoanaerobacteraceae bacterium]